MLFLTPLSFVHTISLCLFHMAFSHQCGGQLSGEGHSSTVAGMMALTLFRAATLGDSGPLTYAVSASSRIKHVMRSDVRASHVPTVVRSVTECPGTRPAPTGLFFKMLMLKYSCRQHSTNVCESLILSQVLRFSNKVF